MLRTHSSKRFLAQEDGAPFFYLGDTAWELFHRLNREEASHYLEDRATKGFNVIQAVVLAELDGLHTPNPYGHCPLHNDDPLQPNEAYFEHVDFIVAKAAALGMFIGMLPTWGDKWNRRKGAGPEIFTVENAAGYGEWLGRRYKDAPIIWIMGGDRAIETEEQRAVVEAMCWGVKRGDEGRHLMTLHPNGRHTSSQWFHEADWLDFNMCQSGHRIDSDNYNWIAADYALEPTKPCLDGEPGYEDIPSALKVGQPLLTGDDVRKFLYWGVFAGACGHTYGCHSIWQMWQPGREPKFEADRHWRDAMQLPGAAQMQHGRRLMESRPFFTRIPDQRLVLDQPADDLGHLQATRDREGTYAFVYVPDGRPFKTHLAGLNGETWRVWWYDPRSGEAHLQGEIPASEAKYEYQWTPPSQGAGQDWVLVIDDAAQGFAAPGQV